MSKWSPSTEIKPSIRWMLLANAAKLGPSRRSFMSTRWGADDARRSHHISPAIHPPGRNNISEGSYTPSQRPLNKRRKNNPAWERSRGSKAQSSFGPESSAMSEASGHRSGGRVRLLPPAQRTGGIKKEDIKTGTYRKDMFPLMSIFFFLPRLFNGLCGRGV